ncbi:MAG: adenylosuccinate synthase [Anaerolineae bacterium]|nr:adenylosuccinate synthase [Anaerolineales bacterium]MCQ3976870.1 adenylosuccinate synthase [Anaerolineae bacterium]
MTVTAIVGAQWGDEGKGRIVDALAEQMEWVIRFQGGDNAGHTVINDHGEFKLHLIPSGIFHPGVKCLVGTGCVVNPAVLLEELEALEAAGVNTANLFVSERAHMVMPYHRLLDGLQEVASGKSAIGTTKRGIGPAYSDKGARRGLRLGDLLRPDWLEARLDQAIEFANRELVHFQQTPVDPAQLLDQCRTWGEQLAARLVDPLPLIRQAYEQGANILLEGQLAAMRDLDWGTYPYVTSSNPTATFAPVGAGLPPQAVKRVIGVVKAYTTAVGAGPMPTDQGDNQTAKWLREKGQEYGATTGRPRRCGWFDAVALNYVAYLNGFTDLAITKLDVLDGLPELKICTGYRLGDGSIIQHVPDTPVYETVEPVYESWPGWPKNSTAAARTWADLPEAAQNYLNRIEELAGVSIRYISVGPKRDEMFTK